MFDVLRRKREYAEEMLALKRVLNTETADGKLALRCLLKMTHIYDSSVGDEPHDTYFAEGERSIGLKIVNALNFPTDKLMALLSEDE